MERDSHVRAVLLQTLAAHADRAVRASLRRWLNRPWLAAVNAHFRARNLHGAGVKSSRCNLRFLWFNSQPTRWSQPSE